MKGSLGSTESSLSTILEINNNSTFLGPGVPQQKDLFVLVYRSNPQTCFYCGVSPSLFVCTKCLSLQRLPILEVFRNTSLRWFTVLMPWWWSGGRKLIYVIIKIWGQIPQMLPLCCLVITCQAQKGTWLAQSHNVERVLRLFHRISRLGFFHLAPLMSLATGLLVWRKRVPCFWYW